MLSRHENVNMCARKSPRTIATVLTSLPPPVAPCIGSPPALSFADDRALVSCALNDSATFVWRIDIDTSLDSVLLSNVTVAPSIIASQSATQRWSTSQRTWSLTADGRATIVCGGDSVCFVAPGKLNYVASPVATSDGSVRLATTRIFAPTATTDARISTEPSTSVSSPTFVSSTGVEATVSDLPDKKGTTLAQTSSVTSSTISAQQSSPTLSVVSESHFNCLRYAIVVCAALATTLF